MSDRGKNTAGLRVLLPYLKKYRAQFVFGPLFKIIEAIFELIVPLVTASMIDGASSGADAAFIWSRCGALVALAAVGLCSTLVCQACAAVASQGAGTALRDALMERIMSLSRADADRIGTSSLVARVQDDTKEIEAGVAMTIRLLIRAPFLVIGSAAAAFVVDARAGLIFVAAAAVISAVAVPVSLSSMKRYARIQTALDRLTSLARRALDGVDTIRVFGAQEREKTRFGEAVADHAEKSARAANISALIAPVSSAAVNLAIAALLMSGSVRISAGGLTQGQLVALVNYMLQMLTALLVVANLAVVFSRAFASARRVAEVLSLPPDDRADGSPRADAPSGGSAAEAAGAAYAAPVLEFDRVSFGYGGDMALDNLGFTLKQGERLAIVGGTGSGKSTAAALANGFAAPGSGAVRVAGADVRAIPPAELRRIVAFVPQMSALFSGTVASNLRLGCSGASDGALRAALALACADDFVDAAGGLDAPVRQSGANLSGGQRRRLCIARAFVPAFAYGEPPRLIILDDAFAALDNSTAARLRRNIADAYPRAAVLEFTQRAATAALSDAAIVLADGKTAGCGTPDELSLVCAEWRELCGEEGAI